MYTRINFPTGSTSSGGSSGFDYYGNTSKVSTTIPAGTPLHVYMPYSFKTSVRGIRIGLHFLSGGFQFAGAIVRSYAEGTGTGTFILKSVLISREIPQNTSIYIMLMNEDNTSGLSTSDYVRWSYPDAYLIFGTFTPVVAGDLIKSTDFTAVNQTATIGEKITNSNFTSNTIITADAWNAKWKIN